ncbi:MAG: MOSC domain-containing protein [Candidatus Acidiferrales bacterium]
MEQLGTLSRLRRYPVKGMAGEDLDAARVSFAGLTGDRVYAFVDNGNRSNSPWMTSRRGRALLLFRPRFLAPPSLDAEFPGVDEYAAEVLTPEGETFRVDDPLFTQHLERRFGRSLRMRFSERSMTDARPVSIFGLSTIAALSSESGIELDARRFRANFYVKWDDEAPFFEDRLVGRELRIGETVTMQIVKQNLRCVVITLDPDTAAPSPQVLEKVAHEHGGCVGVYAAILREGIVRAGDAICAA